MKYDLGLMKLSLALEKLRHFYNRYNFMFICLSLIQCSRKYSFPLFLFFSWEKVGLHGWVLLIDKNLTPEIPELPILTILL